MNPRLFKEHESPKLIGIRGIDGKPPSKINVNFLYMAIDTGCFFKGNRDKSQPKVSILVRRVNIDTGELIGGKVALRISAVSGGHMPPGSVIKFSRGGFHGRVRYLRLYERIQFKVNFDREVGWEAVKPSINNHFIANSALDISSDYDIYFKPSPYIKFKINNYPGIRYLNVSCFELFMRTYGSSSTTKRTLLNYDFKTAMDKLTEEYDTNQFNIPGEWTLKPAKGVTKLDLPLIAAMKYVRITRNIVGSIYGKFVTDGEHKFPWFSPWFQGDGTLTVSGFKLPDGGYVGLRIEGFSVPKREITVIKDKEEKQDYDGENTGHPNELPGPPAEKLVPGDGMGVDQDNPPSDDGPELTVDEDNHVEIDGFPNIKTLYNYIPAEKPFGHGTGKPDESIEIPSGDVSPGEPTDDESDNTKAKFNTPIEIESGGTLWEIWSDLVRLHHDFPSIILSVEHYNFNDGCSDNGKPTLIPFPEPRKLTDDEIKESKEEGTDLIERHYAYKRWIKLRDDESRGMLVIKVTCSTQTFYCLEIQRELNKDETEESDHFTGMFFKLKNGSKLKHTIKRILRILPHKSGKFKPLKKLKEFSFSDTYNHNKRLGQPYLYGIAIRKMMKKLDIDIQIKINTMKKNAFK